jgi:LacI family transcriptional regulator
MAARGVDGLLISLSSETADISYLKELHEKGMPMVFFDRITDEIETHKVTANNYNGAFAATEHLIAQGFRNIAHITSSPFLSITKERLGGYKAALQKHGLVYNESLVKYCPHGGMITKEAEVALQEVIENSPKPDAYFAASDRLTIVCFGILKKMGLEKVPGYIGFTNSQVADLFSPTLTTIRQPAFDIGQSAIEMLIQIIESKRPVMDFQHKIMETELVTRESSQKK